MKNVRKKALVICLVAAMAMGGFGCGNKTGDNRPAETISLEQTKQELTFYYNNKGSSEDATEANQEDAAESKEEATELLIEEITEYVNVTDEAGQEMTNDDGSIQTQPVVVETRQSSVPSAGNGNGNSGSGSSSYTPSYDTCKAYWLDMSQMGDYSFNGEFLEVTFEVNDNVPDGSYPVSIVMTDIVSWELVKYEPTKINGEVAINSTAAAQEDLPAEVFGLKVNSVAAKKGDTVTVTVDLANNPGFCGFVIDIQYDANALTIIDASAGKDFDAAVKMAD